VRRAALGPRRAVAGSIVLRGPRAARLTGRLSSNVRRRSHAPDRSQRLQLKVMVEVLAGARKDGKRVVARKACAVPKSTS
jgi:hypothetical protein